MPSRAATITLIFQPRFTPDFMLRFVIYLACHHTHIECRCLICRYGIRCLRFFCGFCPLQLPFRHYFARCHGLYIPLYAFGAEYATPATISLFLLAASFDVVFHYSFAADICCPLLRYFHATPAIDSFTDDAAFS